MDKKKIREIINSYNLNQKVVFEDNKLILLSNQNRTKEDYANIINLQGELESLLGVNVATVDQTPQPRIFDDWDDDYDH